MRISNLIEKFLFLIIFSIFITIFWAIVFIPWLIHKLKELTDELMPITEQKKETDDYWIYCDKCDFFHESKFFKNQNCEYHKRDYIVICDVKFTEVEIKNKQNKLN